MLMSTLYPGQFQRVDWSTLWNIWRPRPLEPWQRIRLELYRKRAHKADMYLRSLHKR